LSYWPIFIFFYLQKVRLLLFTPYFMDGTYTFVFTKLLQL